MVNRTIVWMTAKGMLGGRRIFLVLALSVLLLGISGLTAGLIDVTDEEAAEFLQVVSLATLMPLFGLIVGTGSIGPEIDDGSIIHLLAKPISRPSIVISKLVVAVSATVAFAVVPTVIAAFILGLRAGTALAFGVGALAAGALYCVIFMLLAIITRHAVVLGLVYALVWESLVGSLIPGARNLSVQQWALSVTQSLADPGLVAANVRTGLAYVLAIAVFAAATWYAGSRLRVLTLATED